jgi:cell division transport system permease protein
VKIQQLNYLIKESFRTIRRHKGISAISVVIMSLTLLILAVFLLATDNMLMFMSRARQEMRVYIYLEDTVPQATIENYHRRILSMPEVDQVIYISKEQALHEFQAEIGDENNLFEVLDSNPLPASFRITLKNEYKDKDKVVSFATQVEELEGIEEVRYGKDFLEKFSSITKGFFFVDAFIGLIVILSSVFIISNAVRLSVVSRKRNIAILKLVGATNRFITMPFIIEGALQGAIASLFSTCLLFVIFLIGARFLPELSFFSAEKTVIYIALCVFIGALGSFTALRRFLRN